MSHIIKRDTTALLHLKKGYDFHLARFREFWHKKEMFFDAVTINRNPNWQAHNSKYWKNEWCWDADFVASIFDTLWSQTCDSDKPDKLRWLGPYLPETITSSPRFLELVLLEDIFLQRYLTGQALNDYVDITLSSLPRQDRVMKVRWLFEKHIRFTPNKARDIQTLMENLMTVPDSILSNRSDCIELVRQCGYALEQMIPWRDDIDFAIDLHSAADWYLNPYFSYRLRKIVKNQPPRVTLEKYKLDTELSHKTQPVRTGVNKI